MTSYDQITGRIIKYQEHIIGPLAWDVAAKVEGLTIKNRANCEITITGEPKTVINGLVEKYVFIFGKLGKLQCKDAANDILVKMTAAEIPDSFKLL